MHRLNVANVVRATVACFAVATTSLVTSSDVHALDLAAAIRRALDADPRIAAGNLEVEAAKGARLQAGKQPNPEFSVEIEDFFGSGDYRGFEKATMTFSLQQKFERGGKLGARVAVAAGKQDVADAEIAVTMREIIAQTKIDYIQLLGSQQRAELLGKSAKRFEDLLPLLRRRVEAGAGLPADVSRGELAIGNARVASDKARAEITAARRQLAANWSGSLSDVGSVVGRLRHNGHQPATLQPLLANLDEHPAVRLWSAVYAQRDGEVRLQRATAVPDFTGSVGVKKIFESEDVAFRIGGSIPLAIRDRNEGGIVEAERKLSKVEFEKEAAKRQLKRRVIEVFGEFEVACVEARRLMEAVVPIARRAAENVQSGFDQGRLTVKELLDAHRESYETEVLQLEADIKCHSAAAKVEALTTRQSFQRGWNTTTRSTANE